MSDQKQDETVYERIRREEKEKQEQEQERQRLQREQLKQGR